MWVRFDRLITQFHGRRCRYGAEDTRDREVFVSGEDVDIIDDSGGVTFEPKSKGQNLEIWLGDDYKIGSLNEDNEAYLKEIAERNKGCETKVSH